MSVLVMTGASNAVNLTDGLDGLAAGCMGIVSFTFLVLALIVGIPQLANALLLPYIRAGGEMAVLAGAMTGACLGFLWFNCNPAAVFMGDTGSLAMGGLIGYIAIVIRHELVLLLVGGVFVIEAVSVMLQVGYFKYTRIRFGAGPADLPDGPPAPPLPAQRLDRNAGGRPLLARRRHARGTGAGDR